LTSGSTEITEEVTTWSRGLHWWAILTACATVPLITLGAEVTTKQVGMVDPHWPTAPWHLLSEPESPLASGIGYLIEHGHRLAGWTVGLCSIVLVIGLWRYESRRWLRNLGLAALIGVGIQGLLGGFRVRLNALFGPDLALIHGVFGQLVFALLVSVAVCTSRAWSQPAESDAEESPALRKTALLVVGLMLLQLVLGAVLRHKGAALAQRGHLLLAFAVVVAVVWLVKSCHDSGDRRLWNVAHVLAVLIVLQLTLGVEAWLVKFASSEPLPPGHWLWSRELVRSGHVVVGSLMLATSVVIGLEVQRRAGWVFGRSPVSRLEGAA
jgi:cytochrome c oxidase assembly protein subunit 15